MFDISYKMHENFIPLFQNGIAPLYNNKKLKGGPKGSYTSNSKYKKKTLKVVKPKATKKTENIFSVRLSRDHKPKKLRLLKMPTTSYQAIARRILIELQLLCHIE